jgi:hypothetical protein
MRILAMHDDNDDLPPKEKRGRLDMVPEALKKALAAGVGAVFLTEEGIRNMVSEMKLPKEALSYVLAQTDRTRRDLFEAVSKEVKKYLRSKELEKLLSQMLEHFTIEVKAEIKFKTTKDKGGFKLQVNEVDVHKEPEDKEGD